MAVETPTDIFLRNLPGEIVAQVEGIPFLNQRLLQGFIRRAGHSRRSLTQQFVLRQFNIDNQFYISKSSTGQLFFFFKKKKRPSEVVVDIRLRFRIKPVLGVDPIAQQAKVLLYKWQVPPFLVIHPGRRKQILESTPNAPPDRSLILTDGRQQFLIVAFKGKKNSHPRRFRPKADIWFGQQPIEAAGNGRWEARPFLLMYNSIRSWVADEWERPDRVPVKLEPGNDLHFVLQALTTTYKRAKRKLAGDTGFSSTLSPFLDQYDIEDFSAELLLRLDPFGEFAAFNEPRSFQMGLDLKIEEQAGYHEACLQMSIPDFLISGNLYDAFWDLFLYDQRAPERREALREALSEQSFPKPGDADLVSFLESGKDRGSVFRIDRNRRIDFNLFFVSGFLNGAFVSLIFSGKFEVQSVHPPQIQIQKNERLTIHYFGQDEKGTVDQSFIDYFLRLMWYFDKWMEVI